jgi:hypothetical protein
MPRSHQASKIVSAKQKKRSDAELNAMRPVPSRHSALEEIDPGRRRLQADAQRQR